MRDPVEWLETVGKRKALRWYVRFARWYSAPTPLAVLNYDAIPCGLPVVNPRNIYDGWQNRLKPEDGWTTEMYK